MKFVPGGEGRVEKQPSFLFEGEGESESTELEADDSDADTPLGEIMPSLLLNSFSSSLIVSSIWDALCLITLTNCGGAASVTNRAMRALAISVDIYIYIYIFFSVGIGTEREGFL